MEKAAAIIRLIDGSVPYYLAEKWMNQAENSDLPCKNIGERAFVCAIEWKKRNFYLNVNQFIIFSD